MVPLFKNLVERSTAKNDCPVSLLSVVSKAFEKLVNNRSVDHLEKCGPFSDFQQNFRSSQSTEDVLSLHLIELLGLLAGLELLNISKAFNRDWHASLLHKLKSYGISGLIFGLISSFLNNRQLRVVLESLHKNFQLMLEFLKALFLVLHFSY